MQLNQDSQSPMTAQRNSRHCKISVTQRSSGEPARQGKRQFMIYAVQLLTRRNDSHASWVQSPRCLIYCPTPLHFFEAEAINHLYRRAASKSIGSPEQSEKFQWSKWDLLVSCLTCCYSRDERGCMVFMLQSWRSWKRWLKGIAPFLWYLRTNELFYAKLIKYFSNDIQYVIQSKCRGKICIFWCSKQREQLFKWCSIISQVISAETNNQWTD